MHYFCGRNYKKMQIKLLFGIIVCFTFIIGSQYVKAQDQPCNAEYVIKVDGSACEDKVTVTVDLIPNGSNINFSEFSLVITGKDKFNNSIKAVEVKPGEKVQLSRDLQCTIRPDIYFKCNGKFSLPKGGDFETVFALKLEKAEYVRCTSTITVSTTVSGGKGPYAYKLFDGGNQIAEGSSNTDEISFSEPVSTSPSNLEIEITDNGCTYNSPVRKALEKKKDYSSVSTVIEGSKSVCKGESVEMSVKSQYQGNSYEWKKKGSSTPISTDRTLKIPKASETDAGQYTFSMKFEECECTFTEEFEISVGDLSAPTVDNDNIYLCSNPNKISLSQYVSTSSSSYSLAWYDANDKPISAPEIDASKTIPPTTYYVRQKSSSGCESHDKAKLTITVGELPAKAVESNITVCFLKDFKPQMKVVGAGDYTYNLYDAPKDGSIICSGQGVSGKVYMDIPLNTVAGKDYTYYLETVNAQNCVSSERTTVRIKRKESLILGSDKICLGSKLSLTADYTGGKIVWTKPDNTVSDGKTLTIDNVEKTGDYSLLITEPDMKCEMRDQIRVTVNQPEPPVVAEKQIKYRQNEKAAPLTALTGTNLKWYYPENTLLSEPSPVPATDKSGVFYYYVSQVSDGCESLKTQIEVIVGEVPDPVLDADINVCIADKPVVHIAKTIKNGKYTVLYKSNVIAEKNSDTDGGEIILTSNVPITENGEIEIKVSYNDISAPITKKNVIVPGKLIAESPSVFCVGSNFQLNAIDIKDASYRWTSPTGDEHSGKSIPVTNVDAKKSGTYILAVSTPGCPAIEVEKQVSVTQPAPPVPDNNIYTVGVAGDPAEPLTATPKQGMTLQWYGPDNMPLPGQSPIPATDKSGVFYYYVSQVSDGCESPKAEIVVTVGQVLDPVPEENIIICIDEKPTIQIKKTVFGDIYTVYYRNEVIAEGKGSGGDITLYSNVSIWENTELGISTSDALNEKPSQRTKKNLVSINNLIDPEQSSSSICDGSNGKLTATDIPGAVCVWELPNGNTYNGASYTISDAGKDDAGIYILSLTPPGCPVAKQSTELKLEQLQKPVTTTEIHYCMGDNATLLTATVSKGRQAVWFDESHNQLSNAPIPNTSAAGVLTYYVMQQSLSDENCSSEKEKVTVTIESLPTPMALESVNICSSPGGSVQASIRIPSSSKGYVYSLYSQENGGNLVGQASSPDDEAALNIAIDDSEIKTGTIYYLEIMNLSGCISKRTPVEMIVTEITLSPDELPPYRSDEFYSQRLNINVPDPKYSIINGYLPNGFTISALGDISGIASSYADPAIFTIEAKSSLGCSIQKEYVMKSEFLVSKMFSPNGDGINEIFMKSYKVIIFDRLGRKLFSGDDGWDGTFNGRVMPEDVYFYILYYKDKEGIEQRITGYVTLIKTI
jgi:gliding motility-associated-like protein